MSNILNITNGDMALSVMSQAGIAGDFLPWRDLLHEGPVPAGLTLEELSAVRADFISGRGWGEVDALRDSFRQRDELLGRHQHYDQVILWFEHDLYDQLQLIQLLAWFGENSSAETELFLINVDKYLGELSVAEMANLKAQKKPVTEQQLQLGAKAWSAFRGPSPVEFASLLDSDTSSLPFLAGAILRMLEEYPACDTGLSRTASQALSVLAEGEQNFGQLFKRCQQLEERRFMGDWSFLNILVESSSSVPPLLISDEGNVNAQLANFDQRLKITAMGKEVLAGKNNWLGFYEIDGWLGGVHLSAQNLWCWNSDKKVIQRAE